MYRKRLATGVAVALPGALVAGFFASIGGLILTGYVGAINADQGRNTIFISRITSGKAQN
jgi:hypothetical protein